MENELEGILGTKVDIVIKGSEKAFVKENLEKDLTPIYG
jgi:predicted nucleotidyltransferase